MLIIIEGRPLLFWGGMKSRSRSLLLKIERKKNYYPGDNSISDSLIAFKFHLCVDHHWRKTPIVLGVWN